jgi:hypothetical protein
MNVSVAVLAHDEEQTTTGLGWSTATAVDSEVMVGVGTPRGW